MPHRVQMGWQTSRRLMFAYWVGSIRLLGMWVMTSSNETPLQRYELSGLGVRCSTDAEKPRRIWGRDKPFGFGKFGW